MARARERGTGAVEAATRVGGTAAPAVGAPALAALASLVAAAAVAAQVPRGGDAPWQQGVRYTIEAALDEEAQVLRAAARFDYRNASPDTLDRLHFHLYLNAFRPGSEWARTEERPRFDFASLGEPDHGFERLRAVRLVAGPGDRPEGAPGLAAGEMGLELVPRYPHAPDSTVVYVELPEPLPPGGRLVLGLEWDARPSTLCRRQCREGRHWDLAQWYPRIAVYDAGGWQTRPLYPQGEFYGEFGTYDVTLDLAADQVVGATGVPVEGDPGWRPVAGSPRKEPLYQRGWYDGPERPLSLGLLPVRTAEGRKRVRFVADEVHHFAWSVDPEYRYEGGVLAPSDDRGRPVAIHVLYRPGDEREWGNGTAVERTIEALAWLEDVFGPYPWPQLTNLHRLEGGGTEFPMLIMDGSASLGLIVHETAHQYAHGILANNEWREAWLDEGLASYLTNTFFEERGSDPWPTDIRDAAEFERSRAGDYHPVSTSSEAFRDFGTYGMMAYTKPSVVFYMLRRLVGQETFREILSTYYERHRLSHVTESEFRAATEAASGRDLDWFFDQWLHTTAALDYAIEEASAEALPDGRWKTRVVVTREGEAWMPVDLRVAGETRRLEARDRRQVVELVTEERPRAVELDPEEVVLDIRPENDRRELSPRSGRS